MSKRHLLALFTDFDEAEKAVTELRNTKIKGFNSDKDMIVKSPIEHPEVEEFLGYKPVYVQWFTLFGAVQGQRPRPRLYRQRGLRSVPVSASRSRLYARAGVHFGTIGT